MACVVCEHCQDPLGQTDAVAIQDGFSYHEKCHKCYVCSETNLYNAEVFKGVIFCSGCSKRIFRGCYTARKSKTRRCFSKARRRRRIDKPIPSPNEHRILEMAKLAASSSFKSYDSKDYMCKPSEEIAERAAGLPLHCNNDKCIKRDSAEIGVTTDTTQELLKQLNYPVIIEMPQNKPASIAKLRKKDNRKPETKPRSPSTNKRCSDLRIAELGTSTEIATMVLRKQSDAPVVSKRKCDAKSSTRIKKLYTPDKTTSNQKSVSSATSNEGRIEYEYLRKIEKRSLLDRPLKSILKIPYNYFKKNIIQRSSLVSVNVSSSQSDNETLRNTLKSIFREEITEHQRKGVKRLYSTINRKQTPYKLGWLNTTSRRYSRPIIRCKHFQASHSYRCMRAQAMRLAGPTTSQFHRFRNNVKKYVLPPCVREQRTINIRLRSTATP